LSTKGNSIRIHLTLSSLAIVNELILHLKRKLINRAFSVAFIAISLLVPMKGFSAACNATQWVSYTAVGGGCTLGYYETGCQVKYDDGGGERNYTANYGNFNSPPAAGGNAPWTDNGLCGTSPPTLSLTTGAGSITCVSATAGGTVDTDGDASGIAERGLAWNTATAPETSDNKVAEGGTTIGLFAATSITGLTAATTYYVRPYAINVTGDIGYGPEINFTTGSVPTVAATTAATAISGTGATSGGNVTVAPCALTERGLAYHTSTAPEITDNKVVEGGTTTGAFAANITGLTGNTKYYVRAYGTTAGGTGYGAETWFYTGSIVTLTTKAAIDIHCESFTTGLTSGIMGRVPRYCCGVDALGDLYSEVDEWGIIYGTVSADVTSSTPSALVGACIKDVHISDANGGLSTVNRYQEITGLTPATTYYMKAYGAHDDLGVGYGTTKTFASAAACAVYYSCAYDADVDNRWSLLADCSTADGDALVAGNLNAICYHRHDWLSAAIADMDADIATEAAGQVMTAKPYRLVCQSGSRVAVNNPVWIGGFQLEVQENAQFSHNGTIDMGIDGVDSDVQGQVARFSNAGSVLVKGAYTNALKITGTGEFCVRGTFTQTASAPGSINGDFSSPPSLPHTRYVNGSCVGTATLPIELLSFEAEKENDKVNVTWVTGSEINNDYFEVYASADGKVWESIDVVNGAGNSFTVNKYSIIDNDIQGHTLKYYKLKQVDFDGAVSFSPVKVVDFSGKGSITHVYDDGEYLYIFYSEIKGSVELSMYDVHSRNIQLGGILIEGTTSKYMTVKKEALTPGIYFIQLSNSSQTFSYKLYVR
jgi:hypothetical protein